MDQLNLSSQSNLSKPVTVGEWVITFIICAIPIVGFIMLFVWAFGSDQNPSKKSWAQASLIMFVIGIILAILLITLIGVSFMSMFNR
ncbi:MAG: hypothetical protein HXY49_12120 [Ignavibacteriaceae bacterium]|jgi:hypothetical protein|nr:hypothetical protein [Ignavibacteriaceae bacterium]